MDATTKARGPRQEALIEELSVMAAMSRLVLGVLARRCNGELRLTRREIDAFESDWEVDQYVDDAKGELVIKLRKPA